MDASRIPRIRAQAVCPMKPRFGTDATVTSAAFYCSKQVTSSDSSSERLDFTSGWKKPQNDTAKGHGCGKCGELWPIMQTTS